MFETPDELSSPQHLRRILVVDDQPEIHEDFRKSLLKPSNHLSESEAAFFGEAADDGGPGFLLDAAVSGELACRMTQEKLAEGSRYELAFVDMRMPPGMDGLETIERLWKLDPRLLIVICTAYSDYSGEEINHRLRETDRLLILKKPFDPVEVQQMALSMVARRALEDEVQGHVSTLEDRIQERTEALALSTKEAQVARGEAERANQLKGEFLQNISHELRTPLNGVLGMLELLSYTEMNSEQTEYSSMCRQSADGLARMIEQLLDYTQLVDGTLTLHRTKFRVNDLFQTFQQITSSYAGEASPNVCFEQSVPGGLLAVGDDQRITQIFDVLLNNAFRFTEDGYVAVHCEVKSGAGDAVLTFSITDKGPGIPEAILAGVREEFCQADGSSTRQHGGLGLGLAIATAAARLMKGTIEFGQERAGGTTVRFSVELPVESDIFA